jgi:exopolysaccharide/PEP-CTERM locus tyrosine autokinase
MSLVERALKKIQESRATAPPPVGIPATAAAPAAARAPKAEPSVVAAKAVAEPPVPRRVLHIDRVALRREAILPPEQQERQLADQYRQIKRPIIANALGRGGEQVPNGHLVMIASALPGEGKTFTSINLALSMAMEKDISVLLVDADVAKPRVSAIFGLEQERGLLDLLREENLDIDSVILPTNVPRLSILPAGKRSETATELLASERMQRIVELLGSSDRNRIVLFDSPPLLLTTESRIVATIVGQITLVVRAGMTAQRAVLDALDLLGDDKPIGLVLNQCDEQSHMGYYQYYGQRDEGPAESA